jgi:prolyl 4-hydroxylase
MAVQVNVRKMSEEEAPLLVFAGTSGSTEEAPRPHMEMLAGVEGAILIHNLLTPRECESLIALTEQQGYDEALVTTRLGMVSMKDVRDNYRLMLDVNKRTLLSICERAAPFLPKKLPFDASDLAPGSRMLNERLRFYRYDVGESFRPHYDGCFQRQVTGEQSHLMYLVYCISFAVQ